MSTVNYPSVLYSGREPKELSEKAWKQIRDAVRSDRTDPRKISIPKTRCQDAHLVDWLEG